MGASNLQYGCTEISLFAHILVKQPGITETTHISIHNTYLMGDVVMW